MVHVSGATKGLFFGTHKMLSTDESKDVFCSPKFIVNLPPPSISMSKVMKVVWKRSAPIICLLPDTISPTEMIEIQFTYVQLTALFHLNGCKRRPSSFVRCSMRFRESSTACTFHTPVCYNLPCEHRLDHG